MLSVAVHNHYKRIRHSSQERRRLVQAFSTCFGPYHLDMVVVVEMDVFLIDFAIGLPGLVYIQLIVNLTVLILILLSWRRAMCY